jgi:predicted Zn-dependent protease
MPLLGPQNFPEAVTNNAGTAAITPEKRAEEVGKSLQVAKDSKLEAAGYLENTASFNASLNSKGLFLYNKSTDVSFSVTLRNQEGTGSGYVSKSFNDSKKLNILALTKIAASKALGSVGAKAIEPGKYTVILEPMAVSDLIGFMGYDARSADEGRSYLSKKGGGTRVGEKLFDDKITIYSDPLHPELPFSTFAGDGRSQKKTTWVDKGVVKQLAYSRYWAQQLNLYLEQVD